MDTMVKARIKKLLGENIKAHRKNLGYSQRKFASDLGMSRTSISNIERGRQGISATLLFRIAEGLSLLDCKPLLPKLSEVFFFDIDTAIENSPSARNATPEIKQFLRDLAKPRSNE